jgi:hypothetical protein
MKFIYFLCLEHSCTKMWRQKVLLKHWCLSTRLHDVTCQKTVIWILDVAGTLISSALYAWIFRKLRTVLTNRVLRFLHDKSTKDTAEFDKFYKDYGMFLKEGIVTTNEQFEKVSVLFGIVTCCVCWGKMKCMLWSPGRRNSMQWQRFNDPCMWCRNHKLRLVPDVTAEQSCRTDHASGSMLGCCDSQ